MRGNRRGGGGGLTFGRLDAVDVRLELVDRLDILVLLYTVVDDTSTCKEIEVRNASVRRRLFFLWRRERERETKGMERVVERRRTSLKVRNPIFERHRPDRNASIQLLVVEVEPPNRTSVDSPTLLLEFADELDRADLGCAGDGSGWEDGSEGVKPEEQSGKRAKRRRRCVVQSIGRRTDDRAEKKEKTHLVLSSLNCPLICDVR